MSLKPNFFCRAQLFLLAAIWFSSLSRADMVGFGVGAVIPDDNPLGVSSVISFTTDEVISNLTVTIDFGTLGDGIRGHTYVGDLRAVLTGPGGSIELFNRPGCPASLFGESSNLSGVYQFSDIGGNFSTAAAKTSNDAVIANGTYAARNGLDEFLSFEVAFAGFMTAGDWSLNLSDHASSDTGGFVGWSLSIASAPLTAPEPSTAAFLAAAFVVAAWVRRRGKDRDEKRRRRIAQRVYYG